MSPDALVNYVCKVFLGLVFASGFALASPYVLPLEGDLVKSDVIFLGKVIDLLDGECATLGVMLSIRGEFDEKTPFCTKGEYKGEVDMNFIAKEKGVIFFVQKINGVYLPKFHYSSLAYLNGRNCVAMLGVMKEGTYNLLIEPFQDFVKRFGVSSVPVELSSEDLCREF